MMNRPDRSMLLDLLSDRIDDIYTCYAALRRDAGVVRDASGALLVTRRRGGFCRSFFLPPNSAKFVRRSRRKQRNCRNRCPAANPRSRGVTLPRNHRCSFLASLGGSVDLSMPLGLIGGRPFKPFRWAISSRCSPMTFSRATILPNRSTSKASSSGRLGPEREGGGDTPAKNRTEASRGKRKMQARPLFCPSYPQHSDPPHFLKKYCSTPVW
jgi:hypothetical protein